MEIMKRMIIMGMEIMKRMRKKYEYPSQANRQAKRQENMLKSMEKMEENGREKYIPINETGCQILAPLGIFGW